jgi:hypothetical protein
MAAPSSHLAPHEPPPCCLSFFLEELLLLQLDGPHLPLSVRFVVVLLLFLGMLLSARDASTAATAQDGIFMMMADADDRCR